MDCSLPVSFIHEITQARILEWTAISYSRGYSQPKDQTSISCMQMEYLPLSQSVILEFEILFTTIRKIIII